MAIKNMKGIGISLAALMILLCGIIGNVNATGTNLSESANVVVPAFCGFTAGVSNLDFGTINPSANVATDIELKFTNTGNTNTNVIVSGQSYTGYAGWNGVSISTTGFHISNTLYSLAAEVTYTGTALTGAPVTTPLMVIGGSATQNSLFWGVAIPQYQAAQTYNTVIAVASSC